MTDRLEEIKEDNRYRDKDGTERYLNGDIEWLISELEKVRGELQRTNDMWADCGRYLENADRKLKETETELGRYKRQVIEHREQCPAWADGVLYND